MADVILMDNFSKLSPVATTGTLTRQWVTGRYTVVGQPQARIQNLQTRDALYGPDRSATTGAPWLILADLPNELTTFVVGFRMLSLTTAASTNSASFAVTSRNGDPILAVEFRSRTVLRVHYKDGDGPQTQDIPVVIGDDTYIDFSVVKASQVTNEMSLVTISVDNTPVVSAPLFNNVGNDLSVALLGTISVVPDGTPGYLNTFNPSANVAPNLGYAITDFYVSRNGKRFGKPIIGNAVLNTVTSNSLVTNTGSSLVDVLGPVAAPLAFAQGQDAQATFSNPTGTVAQVSALIQPNDSSTLQCSLVAGSSDVETEVAPGTPKYVSVVTTNVASATLGISNA